LENEGRALIPEWAIGIGSALLGFCLKWLFSGADRRLEKMEARIIVLEGRDADRDKRLELGNKTFEHHRELLTRLERKMEALK
jgi:hypothetical protein